MNTEKIAFLYPTWIRPGMRADSMGLPDLGCYVDKLPSSMQFYLTFGIITVADSAYYLQIDVTFEGESVLSPDENPSKVALEKRAITLKDDYVAIETLHIKGVTLESEGRHDVSIRFLKSDPTSLEQVLVDTSSCSFFVSKGFIY